MVLNKLTSFPAVFRLPLCLLVSAGIHGSVTYYNWQSRPPSIQGGRSAVVVALVPAVETSAHATDVLKKTPSLNSTMTARAPVVSPPQSSHTHVPVAKSLDGSSKSPGMAAAAAEAGKAPAEDMTPADPICAEPFQGSSKPLDEALSIARPGALSTQSGSTDGAMPGAEIAKHDDGPKDDGRTAGSYHTGPQSEALVAAIPNYRNNPLPEYPSIARQRQWQGVVWLLVDVSANGRVDDVSLERSCGYRVLDRAASRAVKRWQFAPATRAGLPVQSQIRIPVRFSLEDS